MVRTARTCPIPLSRLTTPDTASKTIIATTKPSSFPSLLRQKRSAVQMVERSDMQNETIIQQTCPECGRLEVRYVAVQLRGADEGSTIFYTCECGYKYVNSDWPVYQRTNIIQMEYE